MNKKLEVKNPRFRLVDSTLKDHKEVEVVFNHNGKDCKYFVFIKEDKNIDYLKEAKKRFDKDVKSGDVLKAINTKPIKHRPWLIVSTAVLGVAAITSTSLFAWKALTNSSGSAAPTATDYNVGIDLKVQHDGYSVIIDKNKTAPNAKFEAKIFLNLSDEWCLPNDKNSVAVTIKNQGSTDFTYSKTTDTEATFSIEAAKVVGDIKISVTLDSKSPAPTTTVTLTEGTFTNCDVCLDYGMEESFTTQTIDLSQTSNIIVYCKPHENFSLEDSSYVIAPTDAGVTINREAGSTDAPDVVTITFNNPISDSYALSVTASAITKYTATGIDGVLGEVVVDGTTFSPGEVVNATMIPDESRYRMPGFSSDIEFFSDSECRHPIENVEVFYSKNKAGKFSFIMPNQDVYIDADFPSIMEFRTYVDCENEDCVYNRQAQVGQTTTVMFNNAASGYHIATNMDEFLKSHTIIVDFDAFSSFDYSSIGTAATLIFSAKRGADMMITGSAPIDNP